ncbi:MAG: carboxypeptidase-like regulatory domain-containing protein, partial [Prevotellaceae bacterium]|nr:carboxypeptidase-like regulatory domain-containing protein [Prevotellaceae bacterium]
MKKILIILAPLCAVWVGTLPVCAQPLEMVTIEGAVTSAADKQPLSGVYVSVEKSIHGTMTDRNGQYILRIPKNAVPETKIKFSQLGLKPVEVEYNYRTRIDVQMENDMQALDEVVVTGVYNMPRRDVVGSYTALKAEDIILPSLNAIDEMLAGQVAGMIVKMPMRAGAAPQISIRGQSTLLGTTEPLWVVDGVVQPDIQQVSGVWDNWNSSNDTEINNIIGSQISWLNPADI